MVLKRNTPLTLKELNPCPRTRVDKTGFELLRVEMSCISREKGAFSFSGQAVDAKTGDMQYVQVSSYMRQLRPQTNVRATAERDASVTFHQARTLRSVICEEKALLLMIYWLRGQGEERES
ncbi:hypothetical protein F2P81_003799 [Scophthalmus maximus]|uniref:Uncharacterized protein n=1 Tax=Scophthalmus maximus TaxID=52904 RepID=A0A6A4TPF8_SCOMX|nr:hypothetical protein F2P81_003799 [Scophthalmus maximus]